MIDKLAITLDFLGKFLLGLMVLLVHKRMAKEHKIDKIVINEMRREQALGILGIILITLGYITHFI